MGRTDSPLDTARLSSLSMELHPGDLPYATHDELRAHEVAVREADRLEELERADRVAEKYPAPPWGPKTRTMTRPRDDV